MDWFSLASCLLLATIASQIECKSAEKETWSKNSLISGAWGQNPKAHGILSRAWRDQLLNGTLREQGLQNPKVSEARNIFMQHRVHFKTLLVTDNSISALLCIINTGHISQQLGRQKSEELKKLVLSKVRLKIKIF